VGEAQKRAGARGRATWAISMAGARAWVSSSCGEDGADKGTPTAQRERESKCAGERSTALMRRARSVERERERVGAREGSGDDRSAPPGRGRGGARACGCGPSLIDGTHLSGGAGVRARDLAGRGLLG
jgi:hypothetical protein